MSWRKGGGKARAFVVCRWWSVVDEQECKVYLYSKTVLCELGLREPNVEGRYECQDSALKDTLTGLSGLTTKFSSSRRWNGANVANAMCQDGLVQVEMDGMGWGALSTRIS